MLEISKPSPSQAPTEEEHLKRRKKREKKVTDKVNQTDGLSLVEASYRNIINLKFVVAVLELAKRHCYLTISNRMVTHEQLQIQGKFIRKKFK